MRLSRLSPSFLPIFARARRMAKINVLILTHLSRTNTGVFFKIFEILLFSFFFSRVFEQMGKRAYRNEVIYLVISSGLVEGKNARNIITRVLLKRKTGKQGVFNCKFKCKKLCSRETRKRGGGERRKILEVTSLERERICPRFFPSERKRK